MDQDLAAPSSDAASHWADAGPPGAVARRLAACEAALAVAAEVTPEAALQRLVDLAREVVPARYAALGVADGQGRILAFYTAGLTSEERAAIGPLPQGRGLLGELIRSPRPLLVPDIAVDPRSVGFPPHHPPMGTLLGVPILLGDRVLGDLYLTERADGRPFDAEDMGVLQVLAAHAAPAIDRVHLHHRLAAQRDRLRALLDAVPLGIYVVGAGHTRVELASAAFVDLVFGPSAGAAGTPAYGRDFAFLRADGTPLPGEERPGARAMREGRPVPAQQQLLRRADGREVPVLAVASPLSDPEGGIDQAVVAVQDATQLQRAEQLKDDFLALISHEFRTPLTAVHGGAHLLANQGEALDAATRQELLVDVVVETDRLDRLLGNLTTLAGVLAGRVQPATKPVLVGPLARAAAAPVAAASPAHAFVLAVPPDLPPVEADPALLEEVLRNLYENAVKYAPAGGDVRTTATREDGAVAIRVSDQGTGIAPEHVGQVFERFRRPGAPAATRGMGLGLYLSRLLVEVQGGRIAVSSPGLGQGSTFTITLPVARGWAGG